MHRFGDISVSAETLAQYRVDGRPDHMQRASSLPEPVEPQDLDDFEARLEAAKAKQIVPPAHRTVATALAQGTRYAFEIAAATMVGGAIGWMLDGWLATDPWLFLLFLLFGIAAGYSNLLKAVRKEADAISRARQAEAEDKQD